MLFRSTPAGALAALLLAAAPAVRAADPNGEAKAVVAKAVEASGGAAALEKYKASTVKFKGKVNVMGMESDITGTIRRRRPTGCASR